MQDVQCLICIYCGQARFAVIFLSADQPHRQICSRQPQILNPPRPLEAARLVPYQINAGFSRQERTVGARQRLLLLTGMDILEIELASFCGMGVPRNCIWLFRN